MGRNMIRMSVTDENPFRARLRLVRIQPQAKLWQIHPAAMKLDPEGSHRQT